jgi:hypothetical protein
MPYIKKDRRDEIDNGGLPPQNAGELNYAITRLLNNYIRCKTCVCKQVTYTIVNDILGALAGASREFYRRVAVPYEEKKIEENGDVYDV